MRVHLLCSLLCLCLFSFCIAQAGESSTPVKRPLPDLRVAVIYLPVEEAVLSAEVTTTVRDIKKENGQPFRKGDVLLELDDTIYKTNLVRAQAQLKGATAQRRAKETLFNKGIASITEVENSIVAEAIAKAELVVAEAQLKSCVIRAPYDGRVVSLNVQRFEIVQPGLPLIQVVDDSVLRAQFLVPSNLLYSIHIGDTVPLFVDETGTTERGTISHIDSQIDPASSTLKVYARVENKDDVLRGGMRGLVNLKDIQPSESP